MKINTNIKGYFFVLVATLAMSNVYIFSKAALKEIDISKFGFYWFGFALFWNIIFIIYTKKNIIFDFKENLKILIILGFFEIISTSFFFLAINFFVNPALVSFLTNIGPVFVTILSIIFLKEKFNKIEIIGAIITILGAFIINYKNGSIFPKEIFWGLIFVLGSKIISSISTIITKKNIVNIPPVIFSINRTIYLFVFSFVVLLITSNGFEISKDVLLNIGLGSLLGPFLAAIAGYTALKYIDASKSSILGSSKGVFVLITAYLYFDMLPLTYQIIGGLLTIIGIILITYGKLKIKKAKS